MRKNNQINLVRAVGVGLLLLALIVGTVGFFSQYPRPEFADFVGDFYANISAEFASIALTVLLIDYLNERREDQRRKELLVRELSSTSNAIALRAVAELKAEGWLVDGSLQTLAPFDLSEAAIGITIVALGTSVPEIGTSIIAARRGHGDLAVGNAIGSSVFNILGVLGFTATIRPLAAHDVSFMDGAILMATSLVGLVLVARPTGIGRLQGGVLVAAYSAYLLIALI